MRQWASGGGDAAAAKGRPLATVALDAAPRRPLLYVGRAENKGKMEAALYANEPQRSSFIQVGRARLAKRAAGERASWTQPVPLPLVSTFGVQFWCRFRTSCTELHSALWHQRRRLCAGASAQCKCAPS